MLLELQEITDEDHVLRDGVDVIVHHKGIIRTYLRESVDAKLTVRDIHNVHGIVLTRKETLPPTKRVVKLYDVFYWDARESPRVYHTVCQAEQLESIKDNYDHVHIVEELTYELYSDKNVSAKEVEPSAE